MKVAFDFFVSRQNPESYQKSFVVELSTLPAKEDVVRFEGEDYTVWLLEWNLSDSHQDSSCVVTVKCHRKSLYDFRHNTHAVIPNSDRTLAKYLAS
ncbi:hypothetical protein [Zooshikella harenae]|uniref:Uncharacterized protein n=1 Tax=Zooshikella harenae TaxID=2827238 RepID=A0ABS5ZH77_9GAMM|nr:hypothetical protein [Zooshikella harenae]MBU2713409.1 hypothetical protein [Zooshikella harenae]